MLDIFFHLVLSLLPVPGDDGQVEVTPQGYPVFLPTG